ncbi:MAG: hypothetical protein Q9204_003163 [Flavoplaca sp. TL-2023a]
MKLGKRASIPMTNASGIEAKGPWFDGVEALRGVEMNAVDAIQAKAKRIAIVGAGMAGLMTWLCLNMSGFQNLEIVEAGQRIGGRVQRAYLEGGPFDYQYQDVGPMRFPESVEYAGTNETVPINDQQLVFQLGEIMNQMNRGQPNYSVNFIPRIQESPNRLYCFSGLKDADGLPPTASESSMEGNLRDMEEIPSGSLSMSYDTVCKIALQFSTRFWEHFPEPIYGGCSTATDIPGIGTICYPSYKINSTGPGVMLASYTSADFGIRFASLPELEHVQYVLNATIEIHGEVAREQYIGKHFRKCWALDPLVSASWASPSIWMHKLYIPTFFETHNIVTTSRTELGAGETDGGQMIFVEEHTSYTHAWSKSQILRCIRGSVQLLLELGLVDEAKAITEKFMARWISI